MFRVNLDSFMYESFGRWVIREHPLNKFKTIGVCTFASLFILGFLFGILSLTFSALVLGIFSLIFFLTSFLTILYIFLTLEEIREVRKERNIEIDQGRLYRNYDSLWRLGFRIKQTVDKLEKKEKKREKREAREKKT